MGLSLRNITKKIGDVAGGVGAQLNPFDNNQTYNTSRQHVTPMAARPGPGYQPPSTVAQIGNMGRGLIHGAVAAPQYFARTDIINPIRENAAILSGNNQALHNATVNSNQTLGLGANGTNIKAGLERWAGNSAQLGLAGATGGLNNVVERGVGKVLPSVLPRLVPKVVSGGITGAAVGGPFNIASAAADNTLSRKNAGSLYLKGTEVGGVLGAATPVGVAAAKPVVRGIGNATIHPDNQAGFIAGPKAAGFKDAANQGKTFTGVDNKIRFEGGDKAATVNPNYDPHVHKVVDLKDALNHPQLYKQYPELKNVGVISDHHLNGIAQVNSLGDIVINPNKIKDPNMLKSALLHEVTHVVQAKENFANGGSPAMWGPDGYKKLAGEVEARAVQKRMNLSDNQRARKPFAKSFDVKPSDQIVKTYSGINVVRPGQLLADTKPKVTAKLTKAELAMGKALGMSPKDVAKAKAEAQAPPLTEAPKQAGAIDQVPHSMKPKVPNNPMTPGPLDHTIKIPDVLPGDAAQAHLNADYVAGHIQKVGAVAERAVQGLSTKDQALMQKIQTEGVDKVAAKADNPSAFRAAEKTLRNYYDTRIAYDHAQGILTPYRKDYLRDLIPPQEVNPSPATGGNMAPGYVKAKSAPGTTPVMEGLQRDIAGSSFNHAKLTYAKGMEQAYPGKINRGAPIQGVDGVSQQLKTPYGNELFATKDVAGQVNKRAASSLATGALGKYDSVNALLKYVKLGGGSFHAVTEAGNFVGQQLASGKFFTEPGSTGKLFKTFFSDKTLRSETQKMADNGTLEKAQRGGLTWTPEAIKADITVVPHGKLAKYTGIAALHDATFKREIPYAKLKTFEQKTEGLDHNDPQDMAEIRQHAKSINAEFGGINRAVEGVGPQNAKRWSRILLASDFTESKITTIKNAISKGGIEGKLAREVVAGKALLFGSLAAGGAVLGGELNGKNGNDKISSLAGKILDPSFNFGSYKVSLPATHASEFTKPLKPFVNGSKDKFSGLKHYATARLAAIPSEVNQLANNQDYKGTKIYGGTPTKPISGGRSALNIASTAIPIPFSQASSAATGQQSPAAAIANTVGLRAYQPAAPKTASNPATATPEQKTAQAKIEKVAIAKTAGNGYSVQKLSDGRVAYTLNGDSTVYTTKDVQSAKAAVAKDSFTQSGADSKTIGDKYYYKDENGDSKSMPQFKHQFDLKDSQNQLDMYDTKDSGDYAGWNNAASKQLDALTELRNHYNQVSQSDRVDDTQKKIDTLKHDMAKYASYGGGFTKGRSGSSAQFNLNRSTVTTSSRPISAPNVSVSRYGTRRGTNSRRGTVHLASLAKPRVSLKKLRV